MLTPLMPHTAWYQSMVAGTTPTSSRCHHHSVILSSFSQHGNAGRWLPLLQGEEARQAILREAVLNRSLHFPNVVRGSVLGPGRIVIGLHVWLPPGCQ